MVTTLMVILLSICSNGQDFSHKLKTRADFDKFSGLPLTSKYGNVMAVKVVYDIEEMELYYINGKNFTYHYEFCERKLNYGEGQGNFLKWNYSNTRLRQYLLGNINYFQSTGTYILDLASLDEMPTDQIALLYKLICQTSFIDKNLYFLLNSTRLMQLEAELKKSITTITPSEVYKNQHYQAISTNSANGILKVIDDSESAKASIIADDIIVVKSLPDKLPEVAGIIVSEMQTPLSHISILGQNRRIPVCAYTKAFNDEHIRQLNGKMINLIVQSDSFYIEPSTERKRKPTTRSINLSCDLSVDSLVDIADMNRKSASFAGNKAANLGELYQISKTANFKTPEVAFAIPFYFYSKHIKKAGADKLIALLLEKNQFSTEQKDSILKKIRKLIRQTPVELTLLDAVNRKLMSDTLYKQFRFRSSTNAEDIKGFSGAGLYTSETVEIGDSTHSPESAIQKVWASLWSKQAYNERTYFGIKQDQVAMGILAHRSFPDEKVNGVAITKNLYRNDSYGFVVNAQLGDEKVVKVDSNVICDQFICFPESSNPIYEGSKVVDIITCSNLNNNKLVMSPDEIVNLANQLQLIKESFIGYELDVWSFIRLGYDLEFKLVGENRQLYIKQIRPYN
jgi:phosphohistidine swiveling domain-containing protein